MKPLLCLCMMVKNESARIRETLLSARPYVDRIVVLDTGSTDGTQEIARRVLRGKEGVVREGPFVDYATTRNRVLDMARGHVFAKAADADDWACSCGCTAPGAPGAGEGAVAAAVAAVGDDCPNAPVFTLFLSGDEVLVGGRALREFLETQRDAEPSAYHVVVKMEGKVWPYPRVLRQGGPWRYAGEVHEQPLLDGAPLPPDGPACPPAVYVRHETSDPDRRNASMLEVHLPILEHAIDKDPQDPWALYYLAQTYDHLANQIDGDVALTWRMLAMSYFQRRAMVCKDDPEAVRHALVGYLSSALALSVAYGHFTPMEVYRRIEAFCRDNPDEPAAEVLLLDAKARVTPRERMPEMVRAGLRAAEVARRCRGRVSRYPQSEDCEWRALHTAAQSAAVLAVEGAPTEPGEAPWPERLDALCRDGVAAGGPAEVFARLQLAARSGSGQIPLPLPEIERGSAPPSAP